MALVGSCRPTRSTFRVVFIHCTRCGWVVSAMTEPAAIAALNEHLTHERSDREVRVVG